MSNPDTPLPSNPDDFVRQSPDDPHLIRLGIERFGPSQVLEAIERAVESAESDAVSLALAFLRDAILLDRHVELRSAYRRSTLLDLLRSKLLAPGYSIRADAIYTLGKLGPRENARDLRAALSWYTVHDPLRLDSLLFEMSWLAGRRLDRRSLLTELATSPSYLTRWVTVGILWERDLSSGRTEWGARRSPGWAVQLLRRLAQDSEARVRSDARGALDERRLRRLGGPRPVRERDGFESPDVPQPDGFTPRIEALHLEVGNYLYHSGETDYDLELVEAIVRHTGLHPIASGYDPTTYWAPLTATRQESRYDLKSTPPNQRGEGG